MIPTILMAICIADSIHMLLSFKHFRQDGHNKFEATKLALKKNIRPTFLTSLSTSVGFFSLMTTDLLPIGELGLLAGGGTLLAWIFSIFLLTPLLLYVPMRIPKRKVKINKGFIYKHIIDKYFSSDGALNFIDKHKGKIIIFAIILTGLSIFSAVRNEINTTTIESFKDGVPIKTAYLFMNENVGGSYGIELVFDSGKIDGIKEAGFLNKVDRFQEWLKQESHITKAMSLVDIIKDVNKALNNNQDEFYKIPQKKESIAEEMMLYSLGLPPGMGLNHWNSLDNRYLRMMVMWTLRGSKATLKEINRLDKSFLKFDLKARAEGTRPLASSLSNYIIDTFFSSMVLAVILVSILMTIFFRSFKLGVLSMIPNVLPPLVGAGLMTVIGIKIDVGTILITSVCLGVAVDDTIYFLANYNRYTREGMTPREAIREIYSHTGSALIWTTVILVAGFSCFLLSSFIPNMNFGLMTSFVLTLALVVDLTLLPAILLFRDRNVG